MFVVDAPGLFACLSRAPARSSTRRSTARAWRSDPAIASASSTELSTTPLLDSDPSENTYIINGTPTGVWSTLSFAQHDVVESDGNGSWFRYTPTEGWLAYIEDENLYSAFIGTAWADQTGMSTPSTSTLKMGIWLDQRADGTARTRVEQVVRRPERRQRDA